MKWALFESSAVLQNTSGCCTSVSSNMANLEHFRKVPATGFLSAVLVVMYLLGGIIGKNDNALAVSPANVILDHIRPWVYLTAGFYERSILTLIPTLITTLVLGSTVEHEIGSQNMLRMFFFVNLISGLAIVFNMLFLFVITRNYSFLVTEVFGFSGGLACLLVALAKRSPSEPFPWLPVVQYKILPLLFVIAYSFLGFLLGILRDIEFFKVNLWNNIPFACFGFYFGWFYLRFMGVYPDGSYGDVSSGFEFSCFFPQILSKPLSILSTFCYGVVQLCGLFKSREAGQNSMQLPIAVNAASDPVSERRRARALKSLDEKIAGMNQNPSFSSSTVETTGDPLFEGVHV